MRHSRRFGGGADRRATLVRAGRLGPVVAGLLLAAGAVSAAGQELDSLRRAQRLPAPPTMEIAGRGVRAAPGISLGTPSGFGAGFGDGFVGAGYQLRTRLVNRADGVAVVGAGLGDPQRYVGLEVVASSNGTVRSCCRGGISLKLHRQIPGDASVAVGWENGVVWKEFDAPAGDEATDAGHSVFGVVSKVVRLRPTVAEPLSTLTLSLGVGNGRFRTEHDILADHSTANVFGAAALRLTEAVAAVADWTGQDMVAGVSVLPLRDRALVVTPGFADLTTKPRFILGAAYGFDYTAIFR
ncbi:MAG TPA: hypothetical protein VFQ38_02495 [Longimicrobiales bacterium]|nr:hypothetical protein [Longimicrobiales bacterium]